MHANERIVSEKECIRMPVLIVNNARCQPFSLSSSFSSIQSPFSLSFQSLKSSFLYIFSRFLRKLERFGRISFELFKVFYGHQPTLPFECTCSTTPLWPYIFSLAFYFILGLVLFSLLVGCVPLALLQ